METLSALYKPEWISGAEPKKFKRPIKWPLKTNSTSTGTEVPKPVPPPRVEEQVIINLAGDDDGPPPASDNDSNDNLRGYPDPTLPRPSEAERRMFEVRRIRQALEDDRRARERERRRKSRAAKKAKEGNNSGPN
jgi:hypothetical protein